MSESVSDIDFETYLKNNPVVPDVKPADTEKPIQQKIVKTKRNNRGEVVTPTKIEIKESKLHNQGVFASKDILVDEIIEICPLLQLGWRVKYQSDPVIKQYIWLNISCNCKDCKEHGFVAYIPLGYGSLYNHSDDENVSVEINWEEQTALFRASKTILVGEELFLNYNKIK